MDMNGKANRVQLQDQKTAIGIIQKQENPYALI